MGTLAMYPKINKFWCHWLSFHLAHPNTLFAIYLVPSIRPVVYGILLHAYIAFIPVLYCHQSFILCQHPHVATKLSWLLVLMENRHSQMH